MHGLILAAVLLPADIPADQLQLLKLFREEFIEVTPGKGKFPRSFQMGRAAGGKANEGPVHEVTFSYRFHVARYEVPQNLWEAVMGSNPSRWKGKRPNVRGVAMNPVDHPMGGGEGRSSGGRHPCTPWGKPTKGRKTRKNSSSDKYIVKRRGKK